MAICLSHIVCNCINNSNQINIITLSYQCLIAYLQWNLPSPLLPVFLCRRHISTPASTPYIARANAFSIPLASNLPKSSNHKWRTRQAPADPAPPPIQRSASARARAAPSSSSSSSLLAKLVRDPRTQHRRRLSTMSASGAISRTSVHKN